MSSQNMSEQEVQKLIDSAKAEGQQAVEKEVDAAIKQMQEYVENRSARDNAPGDVYDKTVATLVKAEVYPDILKKMKRLEELFSTYRALLSEEQ